MRKYLKQKVKKDPASLLKISLWGSSVSACANESPVAEHWLQMGYSKQLID